MVVAIEFEDLGAFRRALQIASHEFDERDESPDHCIMRERGLEILTCRKLDIPHVAYQAKTHEVLDANIDLERIPEGTPAFVRKQQRANPELAGLEPLTTEDEERRIERWPEHIRHPEVYLKRDVEVVAHSVFAERVKNATLEIPRFVKTLDKGKSGSTSLHHVIDHEALECFNVNSDKTGVLDYDSPDSEVSFLFKGQEYFNEYLGEMYRSDDKNHSLEGDFIVSEVINIEADGLSDSGLMEYRFFVVGDEVVNASRYTDYDSLEVPQEAVEFARSFTRDHSGVFGPTYVLDVARTDKGYAVIELNSTPNSGRYLDNDPDALYRSVAQTLAQGTTISTIQPGVDVPAPREDPQGEMMLTGLSLDVE